MERDATGEARGGASRTAADVCATLVELGRALKGWSFYPPGDAARRDLLDRSWRVLQGEMRRSGPLAVEVHRGALFRPGTDAPIGVGRVDDLARQLERRGVARVAFEPELDLETLGAFLDTLVAEPAGLAAGGGFAAHFHDGTRRGVQVNDADWREHLARPRLAPRGTLLREEDEPLEATGPEVDLVAASVADAAAFDETAPADLGLTVLDGEPLEVLEVTELEELAADEGPPAAHGEITAPLDLLEELGPVSIDDAPLAADPEVAGALELVEHLRDLGECEDDDERYRDLVRQVVFAAQTLISQGVADEGYRAMRVLATHASDDAKRSFAQRESAGEGLGQLAQGAGLDDLVRRACDPNADVSLHATCVLRELGQRCVPRLLDLLDAEMDSERRARLSGLLLAMGEEVTPALAEAIATGTTRRRRLALRLAGETQNPRLVRDLREAMLDGPDEVSREAAQALLRVGDVSSLEVLAEGLASPRPSVVGFAAFSLGSCGRVLAVAPLSQALERALAVQHLALARELVRALGRLGRAEAAPAIAAVLGLGGILQRRKLRDLKLAAVTALAGLPGRVAGDALARAARSGDAHVRQAAALALRRRTEPRLR